MKLHHIIISIIVLCVGITVYYSTKNVIFRNSTPSIKKKIVIFTSFGGGGNFEASKAMESYLSTDYEIILCHAFKEILVPLDPFNFLTFQQYSGEELYNSFVPGKHFELLGWMYKFGRWYIQAQKNSLKPLLRNYLVATKPDMIISVIPVINNIILEVAQELNIPFLLMPTDLDVTPYTINITSPTYEKFHLGLIFDDPEIIKPIQEAHISPDHLHTLGAPLRPGFFIRNNKQKLCKKYKIDTSKPIIMLLMGSQGADEIARYTAELLKITEPFHLTACIGKNEKSAADLSQLSLPSNITMSIVGFTPHIADYMAMSDLLITKSGTLSVSEAFYMNLPLFLDATSTLLPWEEFNHHFVKKYVLGLSIKNFHEVAPLVTNIIRNKDELDVYKKNLQKLGKKNFGKEFKALIKEILEKS
jgi:processive 1,2-diacylglycerol beta-glucosyltransferase